MRLFGNAATDFDEVICWTNFQCCLSLKAMTFLQYNYPWIWSIHKCWNFDEELPYFGARDTPSRGSLRFTFSVSVSESSRTRKQQRIKFLSQYAENFDCSVDTELLTIFSQYLHLNLSFVPASDDSYGGPGTRDANGTWSNGTLAMFQRNVRRIHFIAYFINFCDIPGSRLSL